MDVNRSQLELSYITQEGCLEGYTVGLPPWGVKPTHLHLSSVRCLARAMRPKFSAYKIRTWAMMLEIFHISRLNGR